MFLALTTLSLASMPLPSSARVKIVLSSHQGRKRAYKSTELTCGSGFGVCFECSFYRGGASHRVLLRVGKLVFGAGASLFKEGTRRSCERARAGACRSNFYCRSKRTRFGSALAMPGKRGLEVRSVQETGCGVGWWRWWWWGGTAAHHIEEFFGRMLYQPPLLVNGRIPHPEEGPSPVPTSAHPPPPVTLLHVHCTSVCAQNRGCEHHPPSTRFLPCTAHTLLCPSSRRWPQIGGKEDRRSACTSRSCGCCHTPYPHPRHPKRRHGTVQERHDWNLSAHLMPGLLVFQVSADCLSFPLPKKDECSKPTSSLSPSGTPFLGWSN